MYRGQLPCLGALRDTVGLTSMAAVRLRLRLPTGQSTVTATTWGELAAHVDEALSSEGRAWNLLTGYPPTPMQAPSASDTPLASLFSSGETVVVKLGEAPCKQSDPVATAMSAPPAPPAAVHDEDEQMKLALALSLGQECPEAQAAPGAAQASFGDGERLVRRVIPADNSCLFAALSHAFHGSAGRRERADELRRIVAESVLADQVEYNEGTLGQTPESYAKWITKAENWGGGIELAVLSSHFKAEVAAFDIQTQRVDIFGQGNGYDTRACLLYDGVHYDLIVRQLFGGAPEELDVCVFNAAEADSVMAEAQVLVAEAHRKRAFTDTAGFTLRCLVCQQGLVGEKGALEHAKKTGHSNFAEYK